MRIKPLIILVLLLTMSACMNTHYWTHPQYGRVNTDNQNYKKDDKECGEIAFKDGIEVDGVVYRGEKAVWDQVFKHLSSNDPKEKGKEPAWWGKFQQEMKAQNDCKVSRGWTPEKK